MTTACRILPHTSGEGPWNMALDEALLESATDDPTEAIVRTYEWSTPTLSLGYFQAIAEAEADPRWSSVPIVRRPTGGGALWHDREVTYAVVVPGHHPASRPSRALYRAIHRAIVDRLRALGVDAERRGDLDPGGTADADPAEGPRPFLCFADRDPEDVVFRRAKLVGSAQRRRSGAVLQHGSLLLGRSATTPELPGLADLAPLPADPSTWASLLRSALPEALGLPPRPDDLRPDERRRAEALRRRIHGDDGWVRRR